MPAKYDAFNIDANESAFFKRELEVVKSKTFDVKYKPNVALALFPMSAENPAAEVITWRQFSRVGMAKMISDYAQDFPRVDIYGVEYSVKPKDIGSSYGYSIAEIRRAAMAGLPLETRRAEAARRAIEDKLNYIAFNGDTATGLNGFFDYPGITEYTVASGGTGGTKTWSTKTADQILDDMNGIVHAIVSATNGIEQPDTMLLPLEQYNLITTKRLSTDSDTTVLEYFLKTNRYIKRVEWVTDLKTAGDSSTARMMVYVNDSDHLNLEIPLMFEQFEADKTGMSYSIPCMARTAGLLIFYPGSVGYADGI